jgi:hypothetical protein
LAKATATKTGLSEINDSKSFPNSNCLERAIKDIKSVKSEKIVVKDCECKRANSENRGEKELKPEML